MKGVLILTEGRSGSTWLGSLTNSTGQLGRSGEWLDRKRLEHDARAMSGDAYAQKVLERGATGNGFFSVKIFPGHLYWFRRQFGFDFIQHALRLHDTRLIRLTRRDRIRQAISFARAMQTRQWTSRKDTPRREAKYDFARIARCYFLIQRSYAFWEGYATLRGQDAPEFVYEDMLASPEPYLRFVADHGEISELPPVETDLQILRNEVTEEWYARFMAEAGEADILGPASGARGKTRTVSNFVRLLRNRETKPYIHGF